MSSSQPHIVPVGVFVEAARLLTQAGINIALCRTLAVYQELTQ